MKDDLSSMSKNQVSGMDEEDIHWVITVPAIWNDSAKHFMRLAAQQAGISSEMLTIALEPEAASIYCRHIPVQTDGGGGISSFQPGKKYLVLDAGGGTIDITVHEVCFGGELKELYKATGGAWGGTMVDKDFLEFIAKLTGKDIIERFKEEHMEDYIDLMRDFEIKKRATDSKSDARVTIRIPLTLMDLINDTTGRTLKQIISTSEYVNNAELTGDKLRLDASIFRSFFKKSVGNVVHHLHTLLRKSETKGVESILMVGGYSESPLLVETVRKEFPRLKVIVPPDACLAVLKGAVIFGHSPTVIKERVSKYTYGMNTTRKFDENKHPIEKHWVNMAGKDRCKDIFHALVKAGQTLVLGEKQGKHKFTPANADQTKIKFDIYTSTNIGPQFITDEGCQKIGSVTVPLSGKGKKRPLYASTIFGGTEIVVEFEEEATGLITRTFVDFLL